MYICTIISMYSILDCHYNIVYLKNGPLLLNLDLMLANSLLILFLSASFDLPKM